MAVEKVINIKVIDSDLDKLDGKVKNLSKDIDSAEGKISVSNTKIEESFNNVGKSASNLKGGVKGIATEFGTVSKAAKTSGAAMRTALISTGIGALVVALGLIVDNWDKISEFVGITNRELERQGDILKDNLSLIDSEIALSNERLKFYKDQNIEADGLKEANKELLKQKAALLVASISNLNAQLRQEESTAREVGIMERLVGLASGVWVGASEVSAEERANLNKRKEELNDLERSYVKIINLINGGGEADKKDAPKTPTKRRERLQAIDSGETSEEQLTRAEKESKLFEELFNLKDEQNQELIDSAKAVNDQILNDQSIADAQLYLDKKRTGELIRELQMEDAEAAKQIAELEAQAKIEQLHLYSDALLAVGSLVGKETTAGKALAVASALIDTYAAIAGQLKAFAGVPIPGYAIAQAIATGLAGFAAVKNILSVKVPGQGGGQGGGNLPQGQQSAPSFNVVGTSGVNQIAQGLSQQQDPIQAFVVGSNVTSQQALDRNIVETASIG